MENTASTVSVRDHVNARIAELNLWLTGQKSSLNTYLNSAEPDALQVTYGNEAIACTKQQLKELRWVLTLLPAA